MAIEDYKGVWVFAEEREGKLMDVSLEMLGAGRGIADKAKQELAAVLLGHNVGKLADELAAYGADKVYVADSSLLRHYEADAFALTITDLVNKYKPSMFLVGGTNIGMDLAPTVAAKLSTGLSAHAVSVELDAKGNMLANVPSFGGAIVAQIACEKARPQMATIRPGFVQKLDKKDGAKANVVKVDVKVTEKDMRTKVVEVHHEEPKAKPIGEAEVVICGGFGVGNKDNWKIVEDIAATLGASIGATRPACDEGWAVLEEQMVGQSGKTIRPRLYIGAGISGALHHLIGIQNSKVIVAVNTNAAAPIMKAADYVIVGDLKQILPALNAEFKKLLS